MFGTARNAPDISSQHFSRNSSFVRNWRRPPCRSFCSQAGRHEAVLPPRTARLHFDITRSSPFLEVEPVRRGLRAHSAEASHSIALRFWFQRRFQRSKSLFSPLFHVCSFDGWSSRE